LVLVVFRKTFDVLSELVLSFLLKKILKNTVDFVKIILLKSDNSALALRKRRFCDAKAPLLPCKTYAFGMHNNRFCNALINR